MLTLLTVLMLTQTPAFDPLTQCKTNADCVISTTDCCPGCCATGPYPSTKAAEEQRKNRCAVIECARREKCTVVCEPPASADAFKARCVKNECRMVAR